MTVYCFLKNGDEKKKKKERKKEKFKMLVTIQT